MVNFKQYTYTWILSYVHRCVDRVPFRLLSYRSVNIHHIAIGMNLLLDEFFYLKK